MLRFGRESGPSSRAALQTRREELHGVLFEFLVEQISQHQPQCAFASVDAFPEELLLPDDEYARDAVAFELAVARSSTSVAIVPGRFRSVWIRACSIPRARTRSTRCSFMRGSPG